MTHRTAQDAQNHYVEKMGPTLGLQFAALWQEVVYLHIKWSEFVALYGTNPRRIKLLNGAASSFFSMLQGVLFEEILLHIARLTDPPNTGKDKENLTIRNLPELVDHPETKEKLVTATEQAVKTSEFSRDWRNRHIAHRDLALTMGQAARPLKNASREQVRESLNTIANVLNIVEGHFTNSGTYFKIGRGLHGATSLLYVLDDALRAREKREQRLLKGEFSEEDIQRPL